MTLVRTLVVPGGTATRPGRRAVPRSRRVGPVRWWSGCWLAHDGPSACQGEEFAPWGFGGLGAPTRRGPLPGEMSEANEQEPRERDGLREGESRTQAAPLTLPPLCGPGGEGECQRGRRGRSSAGGRRAAVVPRDRWGVRASSFAGRCSTCQISGSNHKTTD